MSNTICRCMGACDYNVYILYVFDDVRYMRESDCSFKNGYTNTSSRSGDKCCMHIHEVRML